MSKKAILSALLVSSALLGATATHAATSEIKAENKKVTVSTDHAKLYKDSKLKESTTPKNGTVYEVKGYRNIDGKHVYRVYQTNKDGKQEYRGYIDSKDTKDLKAAKAKGKYVLNGNANVWKNFYWTSKNTDRAERVVFAKYEYKLGNGKKYYSVYSKDASGKDVWQGYTAEGNLKAVTSTKESKYVALKKDTKSFANLYFQQTKGNFDVKSGVNFKVTRYYTIDGKKYYSTERAGKTWTGYVDSSVVEDLKAEKVAAADANVKVAKEWNTYSDHFYTKKAKLADYKGKNLTAKYVYTYGNGKKYASLYDGDTWVGYANVQALEANKAVDEETQKAIDAANDAIKKAEEILEKAQASKESKEAAQKVIDAAKEAIKNGNLEEIKKIPAQIAEAIKALKPGATTIDIQRVQEAIEAGNKALETAEGNGIGSQDKAKVDALKDAIANAEKVIADMKKGDASTEDADKAIKAIEDAINELGAPATSIMLEELRNTIRDAEHLYKSTENTPATGREELAKEIKVAKDLLAEAMKDGKVTNTQIEDEIEKLTDAMANVKFDRQDLDKQVEAVKALAKDVYMTAEGQKKLEDTIKTIENDKTMSYDEYLAAKSTLADAKAGLEKQPTKADADALIAAMNEVKELGKLPNKGQDLTNVAEVSGPYSEAVRIMEALEQDQANDNKATQKITKAQVAKVTKDIKDALANVKFDADTTEEVQAIGQAAEKAIKLLDPADQKAANEKLNAFNEAVKAGNPVEIAKATDELVNTINDAQNKELQAEITKAEAIIAKGQGNYTDRSFKALQDAVAEGKEALKVPVKDITADTMNDKQSCTIAIKAAIKGLAEKPAAPSEKA